MNFKLSIYPAQVESYAIDLHTLQWEHAHTAMGAWDFILKTRTHTTKWATMHMINNETQTFDHPHFHRQDGIKIQQNTFPLSANDLPSQDPKSSCIGK